MRFTKIAVKKDTVELAWTKVDEHGATITTTMTSPEKPAPELPDALQAFKDFVFDLIGAPEDWREGTRVTTLSLNEEKEGNGRGLIVSAVKPVAKASGRVLVLNTPHMRQGGDNTTSQTGILDDATIDLIAAAEKAATAFVKGDRMQGELLPADAAKAATETGDGKPVDQVGARRKKKDKAAGTPNEVTNPDKTKAPTDEVLRARLLEVDRDVPVDAIATWTSTERDSVLRFLDAKRDLRENSRPVNIEEIVEPDVILLSATPPLGGDGWTDPKKPAPPTDEAVVQITGSIQKAD